QRAVGGVGHVEVALVADRGRAGVRGGVELRRRWGRWLVQGPCREVAGDAPAGVGDPQSARSVDRDAAEVLIFVRAQFPEVGARVAEGPDGARVATVVAGEDVDVAGGRAPRGVDRDRVAFVGVVEFEAPLRDRGALDLPAVGA